MLEVGEDEDRREGSLRAELEEKRDNGNRKTFDERTGNVRPF